MKMSAVSQSYDEKKDCRFCSTAFTPKWILSRQIEGAFAKAKKATSPRTTPPVDQFVKAGLLAHKSWHFSNLPGFPVV